VLRHHIAKFCCEAKLSRNRGIADIEQAAPHVQFKHPTKKGRVTVPQPERDIPIGTLKSIEKQSGLRLR